MEGVVLSAALSIAALVYWGLPSAAELATFADASRASEFLSE